MPRFVTIGYGDQEGYDRTPKVLRDAAHKNDELLPSNGAVMEVATPMMVRTPLPTSWM